MSDYTWNKAAFDILVSEVRAETVLPYELWVIAHNGSRYTAYLRDPAEIGHKGILFKFKARILEDAPEGVPEYLAIWSPIWIKAILMTNNPDLNRVRIVCFESPGMASDMKEFCNACVDVLVSSTELRSYPKDQLVLAKDHLEGRRLDPLWDKPETIIDPYLLLKEVIPVTR